MNKSKFVMEFNQIEEENKKEFLEKYASHSERLNKIAEALDNIGYFTCPAAKGHHGNYLGGLWEHSKEVANQLAELTLCLDLKWQQPDSTLVIGLLHDLCKTNLYEIRFNDETGELQISYNNDRLMDGHGDLSVIMIQQHIELSTEELMCIRYHMGAFTDQKEWQYYSKAVQQYPNVLWTHTADMIASQIMNT